MDHSLVLGSLSLDERAPVAEGYSFAVLADGLSFGVAQGVREVVTSLLADGDLTRTTRYGNREVTFAVEIEGPDLGALALGEAALRREVGRRNTLTWTAPDVLTVPTVFEVIDSSMTQKFNDLDELRRKRTFEVTLTCAPFARSSDPVTVAALTPPGAPVSFTVNNADTTTGWTASGGTASSPGPVTVTDQGAYVQAVVEAFRPVLSLSLAVTPTSMTTTNYLRVEVSGDTLAPARFQVEVDGAWSSVYPSLSTATGSGTTLYYLDTSKLGTTLTGLRVSKTLAILYSTAMIFVNVHDVTRTNTLQQVSLRQQSRTIEVVGTERTPASIHVAPTNGTDPLFLTIVHTSPEDGSGYSPPLRRWRVSGNTQTADSASLSGFTEPLAPLGVSSRVPSLAVPSGSYLLSAVMRCTTVTTRRVYWSTSTIFPASASFDGIVSGSIDVEFTAANTWLICSLAVLTLPSVRTVGGQVEVSMRTDETDVTLDEGYLFRAGPECALTITDSAEPNLWIDSPSESTPVPTVWVGQSAERSDAHHPGSRLRAMGSHTFSPPNVSCFVAANGTNLPAVDLTYHPRWHSNAAT